VTSLRAGRTFRSPRASPRAVWVTVALLPAGCVIGGLAVSKALENATTGRAVEAALGLVALLALSTLAYKRTYLTFGLAFALLAYVPFDPAPVDVVIALLMATSIASGMVPYRLPAFAAIAVGGFGILTVESIVNVSNLGHAMRFELITLYALVLVVWLAGMFDRSEYVRVGMTMYVVVATLSGLVASLALFVHFPGSVALTYGGARAKGFFKDPNVFGPFLVPAAAILLEDLSARRLFPWSRKVIAIGFMSTSVGVVLAYSRAAWLNYAIAIATVIAFQAARRGGWRRAVRSLSVLALGGAAGLAALVYTGSLTFLQSRSHLQGYDQTRFATQTSAFDQTTAHVLGHGPGQTELSLNYSTHSLYARAAYEQGLLGLVLIVLVLGSTLFFALTLARHDRSVHGVGSAALAGSWLGLIANSVFVDTLHWRHLWVVAALIFSGYYTTRSHSLAETTSPDELESSVSVDPGYRPDRIRR
jgi:hypothetical protein